jgi:hypothetical protein
VSTWPFSSMSYSIERYKGSEQALREWTIMWRAAACARSVKVWGIWGESAGLRAVLVRGSRFVSFYQDDNAGS